MQWSAAGCCVLGLRLCPEEQAWCLHQGLQLQILDQQHHVLQLIDLDIFSKTEIHDNNNGHEKINDILLLNTVFCYFFTNWLDSACSTGTYTIYTKVCGHPFKLVDLAISATPVAERCVKSSTQPCNLHRQIGSRMALLKSTVTFKVAPS